MGHTDRKTCLTRTGLCVKRILEPQDVPAHCFYEELKPPQGLLRKQRFRGAHCFYEELKQATTPVATALRIRRIVFMKN